MRARELSDTKRKLLATYLRGEKFCALPGPRRPSQGSPSLAPGQERMWRHSRQNPTLTCYNEPITIYRHGPLDLSVLQRSFIELTRRHESWRTTFRIEDGRPVQRVHPPATISMPINDVRDAPLHQREDLALLLASQQAKIPFDLESGPLFRAQVIRIADDEYRVFITAHHLILDGVTVFNILYPELTTIYDAFVAGKSNPLPDLPLQYGDFAQWQCQRAEGEFVRREIAYWRERLAGNSPPVQLPTDCARPARQTFSGSISQFTVAKDLADDVRRFSQEQRVTLFATLEAAFVTLLNRYTGCEDITTGIVAPGARKRSEFQSVMGLLQTWLPLRFDLTGDPTPIDLITHARDVILEALSHDDVPFDVIAEELQPRRDPIPNAFYTTMFSLEPSVPDFTPTWDFSTMDFSPGGARVDIFIEIDDRPADMLGHVQYNDVLFKPATIDRLTSNFQTILRHFVANPQQKVSDLPRFDMTQ